MRGNSKKRKLATAQKITLRALKKYIKKLEGENKQDECNIFLHKDIFPLYFNFDKSQLQTVKKFLDVVDSAFWVDGKLIIMDSPTPEVVEFTKTIV